MQTNIQTIEVNNNQEIIYPNKKSQQLLTTIEDFLSYSAISQYQSINNRLLATYLNYSFNTPEGITSNHIQNVVNTINLQNTFLVELKENWDAYQTFLQENNMD